MWKHFELRQHIGVV